MSNLGIQCVCNLILNVLFLQMQVSNVNARSALIELSPPEYSQSEFEISPNEFNYELFLSEKGRDAKYKSVYK